MKLKNPSGEGKSQWLRSASVLILILIIVHMTLHLTKIDSAYDERTEVFGVIYAATYLLVVALCCLASNWVLVKRRSGSVKNGSLGFWIPLTSLLILSYSLTHVVFTSYYVIGKNRTG